MKTKKFPMAISLAVAFALGIALFTMGASGQTTNYLAAPAPAPNNNIFKVNYAPPTAQVEKLVGAGIPEDVIKAYVDNSPYTFNLNTDEIIHLQSIGVSKGVLTEMLNHDKALRDAANVMPSPEMQQPPMQPQTAEQPGTYPPNQQSTADYSTTPDYQYPYYNDLAGYGNWSYDNGYGWGWQPYAGLAYGYYPWGLLGYGGWRYWPNRGWSWYPHSHYYGNGRIGGYGYAGNRYGGGFNRSYGGYNRSVSGFHGGFNSVGHSVGGGAHFSGGHAGGGFGGGHGGGGGGGHR